MKSKTLFSSRALTFTLILALALLLAASPLHAAQGKAKGKNKAKGKAKAEAEFTPSPGVAHRQEVYKKIGDVTLSIDIFEPKQKDPAKKYPAVVFFFGGGWTNGMPKQFFHQCDYFATRGMIAMSADYRVRSRQPGITPVECVKDAKSALRWVRANAARLGVDPVRLAAGGGSAGGHLAAAIATSPGVEEAGEDAAVSPMPSAMLLFNPFIGGGELESDSRLAEFPKSIMPIHNVKAGVPPAIVFLGSEDNVIPVSVAKEFQSKMQAAGARCEIRVYEGQTHGFFNYERNGGEFYKKTLAEADKFLTSLGWLQGSPTLPSDKNE